jgi:hypothetical protein
MWEKPSKNASNCGSWARPQATAEKPEDDEWNDREEWIAEAAY